MEFMIAALLLSTLLWVALPRQADRWVAARQGARVRRPLSQRTGR